MIPIPIPIPTGGHSGYVGPPVDTTQLKLPPLPPGWHFKVTDQGGPDRWLDGLIGFAPCIVWLYGGNTIYHRDSQHGIRRQPEALRHAAQKVIDRARARATTFGGDWTAFTRDYSPADYTTDQENQP